MSCWATWSCSRRPNIDGGHIELLFYANGHLLRTAQTIFHGLALPAKSLFGGVSRRSPSDSMLRGLVLREHAGLPANLLMG